MGRFAGRGHRPRARARAVGLVAVLSATSLVASANAGAQEDEPPDLSATSLTPAERVTSAKSLTGRLAQTDPALLGRTDATPEPVMIKFDYDPSGELPGRGRRSGSHQPDGHRRRADGYHTRRAGVRALRRRPRGRHRRRDRRHGPGGPGRRQLPHRLRRRVGRAAGQPRSPTSSPSTASSPCRRTACASRSPTPAPTSSVRRRSTTSSARPPRPAPGSSTATSTPASGPSTRRSPTWATCHRRPDPARECNFGDNPLTPANDPFVCNNKLIGGAHFTDTYDALAAADLAGRRPVRRHGPRLRGSRHAHRQHVSGQHRRVGRGVRRRSWPDPRHRPGRLGHGVQGLRSGWLHRLRLGRRPSHRRSSMASTSSTSRSPAASSRSPIRSSWPSSTPTPLACSSPPRPGTTGPAAGTANHLSPWVTSVGASTQTREFATHARPHRRQRRHVHRRWGLDHRGCRSVARRDGRRHRGLRGSAVRRRSRPRVVFDGLIVACQRGVQARVWKSFVVFSGGGEGMVLYNAALQDTETDNHWVPTIHVADGTQFVAFMGSPRRGDRRVRRRRTARRAGRRDGRVLLPRPGRSVRQARHHRSRRADPRRQLADPAAAQPRRRWQPARPVLPGDRRHVDVVAAHRRIGDPPRCPAPGLDARTDQVGDDDHRHDGCRQGGPRHPGRSAGHGRRTRRPQRRRVRDPDVRRDGGELLRPGQRSRQRRAPQPAVGERPGDARPR